MEKTILWQELDMLQCSWTILGNNVLQEWCNNDNLVWFICPKCTVQDNCTLLSYYTTSSGNTLPMFQDTTTCCVRAQKSAILIYFTDEARNHTHSFHWHVQNATIPCRSQDLLPFLSVMYFFLHPSPPTIRPSSLTSSYHLFLGLPLNFCFANSCTIHFWEMYYPKYKYFNTC